MNQNKKQGKVYAWLLLAVLGLTWGSSYLFIKKGLVAFSPNQLAYLRISISALCFFPFFIMRYKEIKWNKLKYYAIVGFAGSGIPAFLYAMAQTQISSSVTGILSSLTPLFTLVLGVLVFDFKIIKRQAIGIGIGLFGALFLVFFGKEAGISGSAYYALLVVLATALYAYSANTIKASLQEEKPLTISAVAFTLVGIPSTILLLNSGVFSVLETNPGGWTALGFITLLAVFGTVIASVLYFKLVQITTPVFASTVSYIIPCIAVFLGALDGELFTVYHVIGMVFILFGVYLSKK